MKILKKNHCSWAEVENNFDLWVYYTKLLYQHLEKVYPFTLHGNYKNPTDEVFYIILSKKTPPDRYRRVYKELRRECGSWDKLRLFPTDRIAQILQPLGISTLRAQQMRGIADKLYSDFGRVTLLPLKNCNSFEARRYLKSLPGIGEKSARCVMMYSLGFDISPMDTHATRVTQRFGLLPEEVTSIQAHSTMDERLPQGMALKLHVNLISHGRSTCNSRRPSCGNCILNSMCHMTKNTSI